MPGRGCVIRPIRGSSHIVYVYRHIVVPPSDQSLQQLRMLDSRLAVLSQSVSQSVDVELQSRAPRRWTIVSSLLLLINYGSLPPCLFGLRSRNTSLPLTSYTLGD